MADKTKIQSRKVWREAGYNVENAEFFVQIGGGRKVKRDLFGFVDLVAIPRWGTTLARLSPETIYLQVTSWAHVPTRRRKILNETTGKGQWETPLRELALGLMTGGARVLVEGWRKTPSGVWERRQHWFDERELLP